MGKTALATNIAYNAAQNILKRQEKSSIAFFSLEMSSEGECSMSMMLKLRATRHIIFSYLIIEASPFYDIQIFLWQLLPWL